MKKFALATALVLLASPILLQAQNPPAIPSVNGTPSVSIAPGGPSGAFELGGFEDINIYNGQVNIALPLYTIKGRGKAGFTLGLLLSQKPWTVQTTPSQVCVNPDQTICYTTYSATAASAWWSPGAPAYVNGAGAAFIHNSGADPTLCPGANQTASFYAVTFSYISFIGPDGTEHNLYDTKGPNGYGLGVTSESGCSTSTNRGTTFVARDGSGLTFVSDFEIDDDATPTDYPTATAVAAAGTLYFKDGTKYHLNYGPVDKITDANGNQTGITFQTATVDGKAYPTNEIANIVDSVGRTVTLQYAGTDEATTSVSYLGAGGTSRTINIQYANFETRIRSDLGSPYPDESGPHPLVKANLVGRSVVAAVALPNGQSYQFYYDAYGEIARIVLPTGGAIEYDFGPGIAPNPSNGAYASGQLLDDLSSLVGPPYVVGAPPPPPWQPVIYRRLLERRTYTGGGSAQAGTLPSSTTTYSRPESLVSATTTNAGNGGNVLLVSGMNITSAGYVEVTQSGANVSTPITTRHYFHSNPSVLDGFSWGITAPGSPANDLIYPNEGADPSIPRGYPDPFMGKEFKTDIPSQQTIQKVWGIIDPATQAAQVCQENTTLYSPDGSQSATRGDMFFYDLTSSGAPAPAVLEDITDHFEFDYGAPGITTQTVPSTVHPGDNQPVQLCPSYSAGSTALRHTHVDYVTGQSYLTAFLKELPVSSLTCGSGLCDSSHYAAKSTYFYDNNNVSQACNAGVVAQLKPTAAQPSQQDSAYGATGTNTRGNLNCELHAYRNTTGTEQQIDRTYEFDQTGNLLVARDANHNATTFSYSQSCGKYANSFAFATTVTNALSQPTQVGYDCDLGIPNSITDRNKVTSTYSYNSPTDNFLDRLAQVVESASSTDPVNLPPLKRTTTFTYADSLSSATTDDTSAHASVTAVRDEFAGGDQIITAATQYDGFGRTIGTSLQEPNSTINTVTDFDGLGRTWRKSNPVRGIPQISDKTAFVYDVLGRTISTQFPDGSSSSTLYNRNFWTETDPAGRSRTTTTDGLDRLAAVAENNLGTPATTLYNTAYSYDILGDLVQVNQSGQTRCAYYDELKRVKATANPETSPANTTCSPGTLPSTATTTYTYDNNGNVLTKTSPAGIVTNFAPPGSPIDALNRVTQKTYSDGTPTASFSYDSCEGGVGRLCGSNAANSNGFSSALSFTYDSLGRAAGSTQTTNGIPYAFSYTWNLLDGPITIAYPSHRLVTYNYDSDGRVNTITGAATPTAMPTTYVKSVQWAPQTAPSLVSLGNGLVQQYCYNNRLQVAGIRTGATEGTDCSNQSGDLFQLALNYNNGTNNGNLWGQTQKVPNDDGSVLTLTEVYNYDAVNRLQSANESSGTSSWNVGFGYDPFGNQWLSSSTIPTPVSAPVQQSQFDATTNRIVNQPNGQPMPADAYDADGNLRDHPMVGQMSYDAEGRLTQFSNAGLVSRFWYDAAGHRVLKTTGANSTSYVYDASGDLIAEYGTPSAASGTQFLTTDHLGSTRLVTDAYGLRQSCADYFPFGGEIATDLPGQIRAGASCYTAMSKPTEKFTGKERDAESGLDYFGARYYGSSLGRFTSPDWSARPTAVPYADFKNPQSLNQYAYVLGNPLSRPDLDGHVAPNVKCQSDKQTCQAALDATVTAILSAPHRLLVFLGMADAGKTGEGSGRFSGNYADGQKAYRTNAPRDNKNNPEPLPEAEGAHTRLQMDKKDPTRTYSGTEFDANGKAVKRVDFAGRQGDELPHEHPYNANDQSFGPKQSLSTEPPPTGEPLPTAPPVEPIPPPEMF